MTEEKIIDYSRQRNVNRVFVVIAIIFCATGFILNYMFPTEFYKYLVFIALPAGLFVISIVFGAGSKRAIDYIPGEWETRKAWVSFADFEEMLDKYEEAYGEFYSNPADCLSCICSLVIILVLDFLILISQLQGMILISPTIDPPLLLILDYSIVAVAGFVLGFRIPSIDAQEFFKRPAKGDAYDFARELSGVSGIRAGMNVELGVRGGVQTIISSEVKAYVQNLPETVQIQVQVSHSGFAYPYLVGTAYKGGRVTESEDTRRIGTRYPARLEYSMDDDVMVIVARFDIPKRTSSVPNISNSDFRQLAALLAGELQDNYSLQ